jgi:hypothetical protein
MNNQPKNHHYVPAFHLSMFTASGTDDGELWVVDKKRRRSWQSTPKNTAKENNFYTVAELTDVMAVEKGLSQVEGKCAPVVRDVVANKRLPSGEDFQILLNFVALAVVRVPNVRAQFGRVVDQMTKRAFLPALLGQNGAELLRYLAAMDGQSISDEEIQELQAFVASGEYDIDLDRTWHIQTMVELFGRMLAALSQRNWAVWTAADDAGDFVCSDQPVTLWDLQWPPSLPPHFAQSNTMLTFPLSRRVMLVSQFEELPSDSYVMDRTDVALMNTHRTMYANQIYSAQEHWTWTPNGEILDSRAFLDRLEMVNA